MSKQSVCDVFDVAEEQGITYDAIRDMPDDEAYRPISPDRNNHEPAYCSPDRGHVHRELPIRQGVCGLVGVTLREQELVDGLIAEVGHVRVPDPHLIGGIEGVCDPMLAEPPHLRDRYPRVIVLVALPQNPAVCLHVGVWDKTWDKSANFSRPADARFRFCPRDKNGLVLMLRTA